MFSIGGLEKLEPGARSGRRPAAPNRGASAGGLPPLTRDQTPAKQSCFATFRIDVLNLLYSVHSSEPPMPPSTEISSRPWDSAARCELSTKMDPRGVCPEPPSSGPPTVLGQRQRSWRPACSRGFSSRPVLEPGDPPQVLSTSSLEGLLKRILPPPRPQRRSRQHSHCRHRTPVIARRSASNQRPSFFRLLPLFRWNRSSNSYFPHIWFDVRS